MTKHLRTPPSAFKALLACGLSIALGAFSAEPELPVFGEPGSGRISVKMLLGYKGAKRGVHWIPKGTTVAELLQRSLPAAVLAKKPHVVIEKGVEPDFSTSFIQADQASRQVLENGDVIRKYGY